MSWNLNSANLGMAETEHRHLVSVLLSSGLCEDYMEKISEWERLGLFMSVEDEVQICTIPLHISSAPLACLMPDVPLPFLNSWQGQAKMRWASFHPL